MTAKHPERIYFGQLVRALREEHSLRKGLPLSSEELAERINWTKERVGAMERGEIRHIPPDILINLANAFSMTVREREAFLQAYTICPKQRFLDPADRKNLTQSRLIIHDLYEKLSQLTVPAFLINPVGDLLIVNGTCFKFFRADPEEAMSPPGNNILSIVFGMVEKYKEMGMSDAQWYDMSVKTTGTLRGLSLQYRATPKFKDLVEYLIQLSPRFSWCWRGTYLQEVKETVVYQLKVPISENLIAYMSCNSTILTPFGPVTLVQYLPTNSDTQSYFSNLKKAAGNTAYQVQPWQNPFFSNQCSSLDGEMK